MQNDRQKKMMSALQKETAIFLQNNALNKSIVSVTDLSLSSDRKHATILLSVYPDTMEKEEIKWANQNIDKLYVHLKKKIRAQKVPILLIKVDMGEKKRMELDEILRRNGI